MDGPANKETNDRICKLTDRQTEDETSITEAVKILVYLQ